MPKAKEPIYNTSYDQMANEILATGRFESLNTSFQTTQTNDYDPENDLDIKLINGAAVPKNEAGLDSLAKEVGTIVKRSIKNINDYHLVTVIFEKRENGLVVESSTKNIFVLRSKDL